MLLLELRTGQRVALRSTGAFTAPGVDLLTRAEPRSTAADFTELTGLPLERGPGPRRARRHPSGLAE